MSDTALTISICNQDGMRATLSPVGAALCELHVPDSENVSGDVVSSHPSQRFSGVTVGRVANRIGKGMFVQDGELYHLTRNEGDHHLHGGSEAPLGQMLWSAECSPSSVRFHVQSPDGADGYPGTLDVWSSYSLTDDNTLIMEFKARTDRPTPVNLTNHTYWNLGGPIQGHELQIQANHFAPTDDELIPTGKLEPVAGTDLDFTRLKPLGTRAFDCTFGLDSGAPAATLKDPVTGRCMEVRTTQVALQLFTTKRALCLEAQGFPNAVHQESFPSVILHPDKVYTHTTIHRFWNESPR